jgi:hypothetical protein
VDPVAGQVFARGQRHTHVPVEGPKKSIGLFPGWGLGNDPIASQSASFGQLINQALLV